MCPLQGTANNCSIEGLTPLDTIRAAPLELRIHRAPLLLPIMSPLRGWESALRNLRQSLDLSQCSGSISLCSGSLTEDRSCGCAAAHCGKPLAFRAGSHTFSRPCLSRRRSLIKESVAACSLLPLGEGLGMRALRGATPLNPCQWEMEKQWPSRGRTLGLHATASYYHNHGDDYFS